jgi:hypothetical protein
MDDKIWIHYRTILGFNDEVTLINGNISGFLFSVQVVEWLSWRAGCAILGGKMSWKDAMESIFIIFDSSIKWQEKMSRKQVPLAP